ncbi:acyl transferase/acyl hydrolase/lysophospholipase [Aspergillus pseudotamarii]|uniref:Acyl transferase/acyl hydrolase/lysophospholipase n=1 Tax=Aspergillus pseudotamarii TaxID=132259 RepID=A0A5N6SP09_ASPPS|nr:acyl transferase/acyl hydrolase/lysophospholipase [Aspergillus pseudotamarii]KAE8136426.1 acyl transferase/acyl hydrolase/lysophospholipase [Aspergillus pseudotamarii]
MTWTREAVETLPPLPTDLSSVAPGKYAVKCEISDDVWANDGYIKAKVWFKLPVLTDSFIDRLKNIQLFAKSKDQGFVSDREAGTWTWFELVLLGDGHTKSPLIRDNVEYIWKSHFNPMETEKYQWPGQFIGVRICARFPGWWIFVEKGYLAVEIGDKPVTRLPPQFGEFSLLQDTLQEVNEKLPTEYDLAVPPMRADGFDAGTERPLRVLSLDGGGVRGLSSLYILRDVMQRLNPGGTPPKPCDVFDMIAGTSTGGLCAIMLGRLEMSVDECIEAYKKFMKRIFNVAGWRKNSRLIWKGSRFAAENIEAVIKEVMHEKLGDPEAPLLNEHGKCKAFVLAVRQDAANSKGPVHLRSYVNTQQKSLLPNVKAWEAARATSAAPTYFPPMEIATDNGVKHKLIDAALGANNPVGWLWNEVLSVFGAGRPIDCILSIGTGIPKNQVFGESVKGAIAGLGSAITNSELANILFRTLIDAYAPESRRMKYFRLNVGREIEDWPEDAKEEENEELAEMDSIEQIDGFIERTEQYIKEQEPRIRRCAGTLNRNLFYY